MRTKKAVLMTILVASVSGCQSTTALKQDDDEKLVLSKLDKLLVSYAERATLATETLTEHKAALLALQRERDANYGNLNAKERLKMAPGMEGLLELKSWQGPFEKQVDMLAKLSGYRVTYEGPQPVQMSYIKLKENEKTIMDWFWDISNQVDKFGIDIDIYPSNTSSNMTNNGLIVVTYGN